MDEIERRERLECDPSRVFLDDEDSSASEEEEDVDVETLESVSKLFLVKNGQCMFMCQVGNKMAFSSTHSMSLLSFQLFFVI